jgi:hypothetical protein
MAKWIESMSGFDLAVVGLCRVGILVAGVRLARGQEAVRMTI